MSGAIVVTGGYGYLGGRIIDRLRHGGAGELRVTTRRAPDHRPLWADGLTICQAGLDGRQDLERACAGAGTIIHLAATNASVSAENPEEAENVNVRGTANLVAAAERAGVRRFIYFSTAHVYRSPLSGTIDETTPTTNSHPYAATHRAAEDIVRASSLESVVFRLSNGFGAPADAAADCWMLVANDLCRQAAVSGRMVLRGSGRDLRDFIPLADVAGAVDHFLNLPSDAWGDGLFNLGSGASRSVFHVAELIAERSEAVLGSKPEIECKAPGEGDGEASLHFEVGKLLRTGFQPGNDGAGEIDDTLRLCREWFS